MPFFDRWFEILDILEQVDDVDALKTYACMMLDYAASKAGNSTEELIETLLPIIRQVNSELGPVKF